VEDGSELEGAEEDGAANRAKKEVAADSLIKRCPPEIFIPEMSIPWLLFVFIEISVPSIRISVLIG
jgi:hypothetical protein